MTPDIVLWLLFYIVLPALLVAGVVLAQYRR